LLPEAFRRTMGAFATGVSVVAWRRPDGTPAGLTVNALTSVSLEPTMILVCIDHRAESHKEIAATSSLGVSVLAAHQEALSRRFADKRLDPAARFIGVAWDPGPLGAPWLRGALAHLEGPVVRRLDAGDHTLFLIEVQHGRVVDGRPLVFFRGAYGQWTTAETACSVSGS
jgi:flavin reductase (DIM6/NTAB) family NADH-FMN oxidoreductase RutF